MQVPFADGHLLVPDRPGLGVEFDEDAAEEVAREAAARRGNGEAPDGGIWFSRDDGSYTNW